MAKLERVEMADQVGYPGSRYVQGIGRDCARAGVDAGGLEEGNRSTRPKRMRDEG
jgi:hypothetical protein